MSDDRLYAAWLLFATSGLRRVELLRLEGGGERDWKRPAGQVGVGGPTRPYAYAVLREELLIG